VAPRRLESFRLSRAAVRPCGRIYHCSAAISSSFPTRLMGGWLSAFVANELAASDELATTGNQVRQGLHEPQETFTIRLVKDCYTQWYEVLGKQPPHLASGKGLRALLPSGNKSSLSENTGHRS
jgi:hypothetical protein